jgi:EpsI family protein
MGGRVAIASYLGGSSPEENRLLRPLAEIPYEMGAWRGVDIPADPQMIADIKIDQYLERRYLHPSGQQVIVWMSYSDRSADQYHYPTVCMAGVGWAEVEHERKLLVGKEDDVSVPSMYRLRFERDGSIQSIHYWYYLFGEGPFDRWMRSLSRTSRAFLRGRRNGSLTVEIFSQSPRPDDALIGDLARELAATLAEWVPAATETDCVLGATY